MADPGISFEALIAGLATPAARHAGGDPDLASIVWPTGQASERLLITLLLNYLNHKQPDSHALDSDRYRMVMNLPAPTDDSAGFARWYRQASHGPGTQVHPVATAQHCDYSLLETHRSDVASLARFSQRVDHATWYLCVAIDTQVERSVWHTPGVKIRQGPKSWYGALAGQCFARWKTARNLLAHEWTVPDSSEPLYRTAFWSLCELTPADSQLKQLFELDRPRACLELVKHVDAYADQLALAADLAEALETDRTGGADVRADKDQARLDTIQQDLLDKAGARLSLTEAAERLMITRQALHKKIKTGAALGLMIGDTFVLPAVQLVDTKSGSAVVAHLRDVLSLFTEAGAGDWSALQYLIEPDPALEGSVPLDRLKAGEVKSVVAGARAYLGLDEG